MYIFTQYYDKDSRHPDPGSHIIINLEKPLSMVNKSYPQGSVNMIFS